MSIEYRMSPKAMDDFGLMLAAEDDEGAKEIAMEAIERLPDDEDYNLWTLARVEREEDEHLRPSAWNLVAAYRPTERWELAASAEASNDLPANPTRQFGIGSSLSSPATSR